MPGRCCKDVDDAAVTAAAAAVLRKMQSTLDLASLKRSLAERAWAWVGRREEGRKGCGKRARQGYGLCAASHASNI